MTNNNALSQSLDIDMKNQDYDAVLHKTDALLKTGESHGSWRWIILRSAALVEIGERQNALRLMHNYLDATPDREVLKHACRTILGGGAPFAEIVMLRGLFEKYGQSLDDDELLRFKAETAFHFGERDAALAEMRKLPQGVVPEHFFAAPAFRNDDLHALIVDVHCGNLDAVYRNFESVRKSVVPGTRDDMHLVSVVGRLERQHSTRERMKNSVSYEISGAKLPTRSLLIETMLYSGEEHLLELHLHSMPFVDHFIVVQGDRSFTGNTKATSAVINNPRFVAFVHKITCIVLRFDNFEDPLLQFPWFVEALHRNAAHATILRERDQDTHIISDVDEVLKQSAVDLFKSENYEVSTVRLREHKFFLNFQRFGTGDYRQMTLPTLTTLATGRVHCSIDPQSIRNFVSRDATRERTQISDGGWHFSSVVDAEGLLAKYANYSHVENITKHNNLYAFQNFREEMMSAKILTDERRSYFAERGLPTLGYMAMPITLQTYPEYMIKNPSMYWLYTLPFPNEEEWVDALSMLNRRGQ